MSNGLFCCTAEKLSLGHDDIWHWTFVPRESLAMNWHLGPINTECDEFGDRHFEIEIEYPENKEVPAIEFRYRHRAGNTGFEHFSRNEYGELSDPEVEELLDWLLSDSWTWNSKNQEFVSYESERVNLSHPLDFFFDRAKGGNAIAVHKPDSLLTSSAEIHRLVGAEKIAAIFSIVASCRMVSIWQPAYGENPVILSRDMGTVLQNVAEECTKLNVPFTRAVSQSALPEW